MRKHRLFIAVCITSLILIVTACSSSDDDAKSDVVDEFAVRLQSLQNVESVSKLDIKSDFHGTLYKVYFSSLLDPKDSSKGTFRQKVCIGFAGYDRPNCLMTTGYDLDESRLQERFSESEAAYILEGNLVAVEHRYAGESVRTDKTREYRNRDGTYWEYLTTENAAADLHTIVTQLKTLFTGKWVAQGASKGGLTANLFCYYHPEDVDVTMPYVAPLCNSQADPRFYEFLYKEAGDNDARYNSTGNASSYRELLTNVQIWLLEKRDEIYGVEDGKAVTYKQKAFSFATPNDTDGLDEATAGLDGATAYDILYDELVGGLPVAYWQYGNKMAFEDLEKFYNLESDDAKAEDSGQNIWTKKAFLLGTILIGLNGSESTMAYVFHSFSELGNYKLDLSYLREAVTKAQKNGSKAKIFLTPEMEETIFQLAFSPAEREIFKKFTTGVHDNLSEWIKTTDEQVIMIYGNSDPWYSVRIPDVERDNVHIFVHPANNHMSEIQNFPDEQRSQIEALLRQYMY